MSSLSNASNQNETKQVTRICFFPILIFWSEVSPVAFEKKKSNQIKSVPESRVQLCVCGRVREEKKGEREGEGEGEGYVGKRFGEGVSKLNFSRA
jgi:hypothetical protein